MFEAAQRKAIRVKTNIDVKIYDGETLPTPLNEGRGLLLEGRILDISTLGAKICCSNITEEWLGKIIKLNFNLKKIKYLTGKEMNVKAEIVRKYEDNTYGVKFIDLDIITKEKIRDYVEFKIKEGI